MTTTQEAKEAQSPEAVVDNLKDKETPAKPSKTKDEQIVDRLMGYAEDPLDAVPFIKAIFYGDVGSGKTTAACKSPDPVLFAIERGQSSLLNDINVLKNVKKVFRYVSVNQVEQFAEQFKKGAFPQYKTIIIDTFSELQDDALTNRIVQQHSLDPIEHDKYRPEGGDYQANTEHMRRIASAFKDVQANVIFVCHDKDEVNEKTKFVTKRPSPTVKVAKVLNQYADLIVYFWSLTDDKEVEHFYARTRKKETERGLIIAKSRIGTLPTVVENFNFNMALKAKDELIAEAKKAMGKK